MEAAQDPFWGASFFLKARTASSLEVRSALFGWSVEGVTELVTHIATTRVCLGFRALLKVVCVLEDLKAESFFPTDFTGYAMRSSAYAAGAEASSHYKPPPLNS